MFRLLVPLAGLLLVFSASPTTARQDENPIIDGRPASEWASILENNDPSARKRTLAVAALAKKPAYPKALPWIGKSLRLDSSAAVRYQAATAAAGLNLAGVPDNMVRDLGADLVDALKGEKDPRVRKEIAATLGRYPKFAQDAVEGLTDALKDTDAGVRAAAVDTLSRAGPAAKPAVPALLPLLNDADRSTRLAAIVAVGRIPSEDIPATAAALVARLAAEKEGELRREIVVSLGLVGDKSEPVIGAVTALLKDADLETRRLAVRTLGRFGTPASSAATELIRIAETEKDKDLRLDAVRAFGSVLGTGLKDRAKDLIRVMEKDPEFEIRIAAIEEFAALGYDVRDNREIMDALGKRRGDPHGRVSRAAQEAIRRIETPPKKKDS